MSHFLNFYSLYIQNNHSFYIFYNSNNMKSTKDKLQNFIKQMSHFDPDNMQMGAKAVSELVMSGQLNLEDDQQTSNLIREAFMKQMESQNYNVHAYAIRCIAEMVPKLPSKQVQIIFAKIINSIADPNLDQKKRQIYGICAGTVIHQAADQYGLKLCDLFVQSINQLMKSKDQKNQIEVMLINVISEFIRKWPNVAANPNLKFDRKNLVIYLLKNVQIKSKLQIVKKSQTALGKIAIILNKETLQTLFQDSNYGLVKFLINNKNKYQSQNLKHMRNGLLCLSNILKTHNSQIKYWSQRIAQILLQIINIYKTNDNIDQIDYTCDILDSSIICLSYLLKSYSRQLNQLIQNNKHPLSNFVTQLINFNIQGQMSYVSLQQQNNQMTQQYQGGDDYDYYQPQGDADQKCWKVRRATMHYITVLLKKDYHFKNQVNSSSQLINALSQKLIETNSMVSQMAFQTFNSLVELISIQKINPNDEQIDDLSLMRVKSTQKDLATKIVVQLNNKIQLIFESSKFTDQIKIQGGRIIYRLIQIYKDELNGENKLSFALLKTLQKQLGKCQILQNKNYILLSIKELITNLKPFNSYQTILSLIIKNLTQPNLKIVSSAYKCLRSFLRLFPKQLYSCQHFQKIIMTIQAKLKEHDADRIIKTNVVKCLGPIFTNYLQKLKTQDQKDIFQSLNAKLKIQIQKGYLLEQISRIPDEYKVKKQNSLLFKETLILVSNNLGSVNAELNIQAINSSKKLIQSLDQFFDNKTAQQILMKSKPIFAQNKIPAFLDIIIEKFPKSIKNYSESIVKSTQIDYIIKLLQKKIINQAQCIKILKTIDREDSNKNISQILAKIGVSEKELMNLIQESNWGIICLGAIGYIGNEKTSNFLLDLIKNNKNENLKFEASSALGNIASRFQKSLIPIIIQQANKSSDPYIFIYTLKEFINFLLTSSSNSNIQNTLTSWLFQKSQAKFEGQSIYYLISQCIGKIAFLSQSQIKFITKQGQSSNQNFRFIVANSLRFYFQNRQNLIQDQSLFEYLKTVLSLVSDKDVNVRCSATKSLNSIALNYIHFLKSVIDETFWKTFKKNLQLDESLIIQVDYGISKEKKDLGRPLRIQSYNLLKLLIRNLNLSPTLIDDLMSISLANLNKQTSTDLVLKRLSTIRKLCSKDFTQFIAHSNVFLKRIGIQQGILKSYEKKKQAEDERTQIYLKGILRQIVSINKIAQKQNLDLVRGYITTLRSIERFNLLLDTDDVKNQLDD